MYFIYSKYVVNGVTWEIIQRSPRSNVNVLKDGVEFKSVHAWNTALEVVLNQFKVED